MSTKHIKECGFCGRIQQIIGRGWCGACYSRQLRHGSPEYREGKSRTKCSEGCGRNVVSHGLCATHWARMQRFGQVETLRPADWGTRTAHPLYIYWTTLRTRGGSSLADEWYEDFWSFVAIAKERPSKNHFIRAVRVEEPVGPNNFQWVEGIGKARRHELKRARSRNHDSKKLRISHLERNKLFESAGNKCEICGATSNNNDCPVTGEVKVRSLCIDHSHKTGEARGVLCRSCNAALGLLKDDINVLRKAIEYLTEH